MVQGWLASSASRLEYNINTWVITIVIVLLVHVLASVAFFGTFLRRIFTCTLVAVTGLSGFHKLLICLIVFLSGATTSPFCQLVSSVVYM